MTFEELLEMPADDINKLTDAQLEEWLRPFFPLTRPRDTFTIAQAMPTMAPDVAAKLAALKSRPSLKSQLTCTTSSSTPPASSGPTASADTP